MSWSRPRVIGAAVTAVLVATTPAACGSDADKSAGSSAGTASAGFPVTLKNTFGETTIPEKPERIVTLGWNAQDVVYALGETPVGMPKVTYGQTAAGTTAWGAGEFDPAKTTLLDTGDKYPFEKIAALKPDVILAPYEGFDEATYKTLSGIAPTVAYPARRRLRPAGSAGHLRDERRQRAECPVGPGQDAAGPDQGSPGQGLTACWTATAGPGADRCRPATARPRGPVSSSCRSAPGCRW